MISDDLFNARPDHMSTSNLRKIIKILVALVLVKACNISTKRSKEVVSFSSNEELVICFPIRATEVTNNPNKSDFLSLKSYKSAN